MKYEEVKRIIEEIDRLDGVGMGCVRIHFGDGESHVAQTIWVKVEPHALTYTDAHMEPHCPPFVVRYDDVKMVTNFVKKEAANRFVRIMFRDGEWHSALQETLTVDDTHVHYDSAQLPIKASKIMVPRRVVFHIDGLDHDHPAAQVFTTH